MANQKEGMMRSVKIADLKNRQGKSFVGLMPFGSLPPLYGAANT